jgi:2-deoxy-D-gluconate 3-dehydrogenase
MASDLFSLDGRVALVTGGSRGIGKMIARGFLEAGCRKVYITARKAAACDATAEELGPQCVSIPVDISTVEGCKALAERYLSHEDKLDILLNNAGAAWARSSRSSGERLGQGPGPEPEVALLPDPGAARDAESHWHARAARQGDQHRLDRRHPPEPAGDLRYHASKAGLIYLTRRMAAADRRTTSS